MAGKYIYEENSFETASQILSDPGTVTVEQDAYILVAKNTAFNLTDDGWTFKSDGTIAGDAWGIGFLGVFTAPLAKSAKLTVGAEGAVLGQNGKGVGVVADYALDLTNSGLIKGGVIGVEITGSQASLSKSSTITNNALAEISGGDYGIYQGDEHLGLVVTNKGSIVGGIAWAGALTLTNTGQITSDVSAIDHNSTSGASVTNSGLLNHDLSLTDGKDVVKNAGTIIADVMLFDGKNNLTNSGQIYGSVFFGSGDDLATNTGTVSGTLDMGLGVNKLTSSGAGKIDDDVKFGSGADTFLNGGLVGGDVTMSSGDDKLTNGGTIHGNVQCGADDDTVANTGVLEGTVDLGSGNNKLTNAGEIQDAVTFGSGNDTLLNTKLIEGAVNLGDGDNKLTNGGAIQNAVTFGSGNDVVVNTKQINALHLGDGDNKLTNSGSIGYLTALGNGDNTLTNSGTMLSDVILGAGDDVFNNSGHFVGSVKLGAGNDTFTGGNFAEVLYDELGDDVFKFGGGNDGLNYAGQGTDIFDGGAGFDTFAAINLVTGYWLNLDSKAHDEAGPTIAAFSMAPIFGIGGAATVKGFEYILLGDGSDLVFGADAVEWLEGNDGADTLYGGGGADRLTGGDGDDTFAYISTKDSGNTATTRDRISDFEGAGGAGGDTIDLSAIDANTKVEGEQSFSWLGADKAFTAAGQLRSVTVDGDTIIQGDVTGDGKADFSILVVGSQAFVSTDFEL